MSSKIIQKILLENYEISQLMIKMKQNLENALSEIDNIRY